MNSNTLTEFKGVPEIIGENTDDQNTLMITIGKASKKFIILLRLNHPTGVMVTHNRINDSVPVC